MNAERFNDFLRDARLNVNPDDQVIFIYGGAPAHRNPENPGEPGEPECTECTECTGTLGTASVHSVHSVQPVHSVQLVEPRGLTDTILCCGLRSSRS